MRTYKTLRLILGDQLNIKHSWFNKTDDSILYVIAELKQETGYVKHHIQKICAFFAAMEAFAKLLQSEGHQVLYLTLDETADYLQLPPLISDLCHQINAEYFHYQRPDEYRVWQQLQELNLSHTQVTCFDTEHFLLPFDEITQYFNTNKTTIMEPFYRKMRKRFGILLQDDHQTPLGGRWNFDHQNRNKLSVQDIENLPKPLSFQNDVSAIYNRLQRHNIHVFGLYTPSLLWPINRSQALSLLAHFCQYGLPLFGRFQDAMTAKSPHRWSLYHSRLSFALNCKLLSPAEVIQSALMRFENDNTMDLAQIEGFIRQILGWREYIRGIYWANMPQYAKHNALDAQRPLPHYYWTGNTRMHCVKQAVTQSLEFSYAHHIQRLMITGNFALLSGCEPDEVDDWYLGIYIDALQWVEMPNTRGMALFADGGIVATKPYAASGSYINKMSDYCKDCHYQVKSRSDLNSCPFNSLYWQFMLTHRERLAKNPRIGMIYKNWDNTENATQQAILDQAQYYLHHIEEL